MTRSRRPIQATVRTPSDGASDPFAARFREALSHWASGVAIVATSDGEEIDAITVSSFSALSIDPPLVLVCIAEQASLLPMLLAERRFTVSILADEQRAVAGAVAQRLPGPGGSFAALEEPAVAGSLAQLDCTLAADHPGGDHRIIVGAVESVELGPVAAPLLYYRREYRTVE